MLNLLKMYWLDILLVVIFIIAIIVLLILRKKPFVMMMIKSLVKAAEDKLGPGTGLLKLPLVVEWLYPKLPKVIKLFISSATILRWIEKGLEKAKKEWEAVEEKLRQEELLKQEKLPAD